MLTVLNSSIWLSYDSVEHVEERMCQMHLAKLQRNAPAELMGNDLSVYSASCGVSKCLVSSGGNILQPFRGYDW